MTILRVMVGVPGAGKSTFIKMMAKPEDAIVSRDKIRFSLIAPGIPYFSHEDDVFKEFCAQIEQNALNHDVVWADATHMTRGSRRKLLNRINKSLFEKIEFYVINTPLEICLKHNAKREGLSKVPENVINNMYAKFSYPTKDEVNDIDCAIINIEFIEEGGEN